MLEFGFKCDTGKVRDINQDAFFVMPDDGVFLIADGVGGHNNGELASRTVMADIAEYIKKHPLDRNAGSSEIKDYFINIIFSVNDHIYSLSRDGAPDGMATTLVMLRLTDKRAYAANVGDSRLYLIRENEIMQVTEDHTYVNNLIKQGIIDKEQARNHPDRNMITRAVGAESEIKPDLYMFDIYKNDILLMCTDGLYNELDDGEILKILDSADDMRDACARLVAEANRRGGADNITAVSIRI